MHVILLEVAPLVGGLMKDDGEREYFSVEVEQVDGIIEEIEMKKDSKTKSMVETVTDIVIGFLLFLPVNFFVLPMFVNEIANQDVAGMLTISLIYTSIALARKFILRRWFENMRGHDWMWWRIPND